MPSWFKNIKKIIPPQNTSFFVVICVFVFMCHFSFGEDSGLLREHRFRAPFWWITGVETPGKPLGMTGDVISV